VTERFDAYQLFLGNIMMVSTLLLGFIITGTALSVSLTGEENYGNKMIGVFASWAGASAGCAMLSMLLAFLIQARGTAAFENHGSAYALKAMRGSTLSIGVAELMIYASLFTFTQSLGHFFNMNYLGPNICPLDQQAGTVSEESFCSQLGIDFYEAMSDDCGRRLQGNGSGVAFVRDRVDTSNLCNTYEYLVAGDINSTYFVWDCQTLDGFVDCEDPRHLKLINDVSEQLCNIVQQQMIKERLCNTTGGVPFPEGAAACTAAYKAEQRALDCIDDAVEDAKKCYQVCSTQQTGGPPGYLFMQKWQAIMRIMEAFLLSVAFVRIVMILKQLVNVCQKEDSSIPMQALHQLGVDYDSTDYDTDEERSVVRQSSGRS